MTGSVPQTHSLPFETVRSALERKDFRHGVLARTQYSPDPARIERVIVFARGRNTLSRILDAWIAPETFGPLLAALQAHGDVWSGSSDAMYRTDPEYVWGYGDRALHLWRKRTLVARLGEHDCRWRKGLLRTWTTLPTEQFAAVHAFLSAGWARRGIRLERRHGPSIELAAKKDAGPWLDPTYDGIDLFCDTAWVIELARAASAATARPPTFDEDFGPVGG